MKHSLKVELAINKAFEYLESLSVEEFQKELDNYVPNPFFKQLADNIDINIDNLSMCSKEIDCQKP